MLQVFFSIFLSYSPTCEIEDKKNKYFQNLNRVQIKQVLSTNRPVFFNKIPTKAVKKTKISN